MHRRRLRLSGMTAILLAALAALLVACGGSEGASGSTDDLAILAPGQFDVASFQGKPLVINFFASWCGPCNTEASDLAEVARTNPDVRFVGIAENDTRQDVADFVGRYGLSYPIVLDDGSLGATYGISGYPTTIAFDSAGREVDRIVGAATADRFEQSLALARR